MITVIASIGLICPVYCIYMPSILCLYTQHTASIYPAWWIYMPTKHLIATPKTYKFIKKIRVKAATSCFTLICIMPSPANPLFIDVSAKGETGECLVSQFYRSSFYSFLFFLFRLFTDSTASVTTGLFSNRFA